METSDDPQDLQLNELGAHRLRCYQGCAIVHLQNLKFETNPLLGDGEIDERNVERLLTIFEIEGCGNLAPEHRVAALITRETLTKAISQSGITRELLLDATIYPRLLLEREVRLAYVYWRHRLEAAESFGERCWLVDLYLDGGHLFAHIYAVHKLTKYLDIPLDALTQLPNEFTGSVELTDGEIYRALRLCQLSRN